MAKPTDKPDDFQLTPEDDRKVVLERSLNRAVAAVRQAKTDLRQAQADERRYREELGRLDRIAAFEQR